MATGEKKKRGRPSRFPEKITLSILATQTRGDVEAIYREGA